MSLKRFWAAKFSSRRASALRAINTAVFRCHIDLSSVSDLHPFLFSLNPPLGSGILPRLEFRSRRATSACEYHSLCTCFLVLVKQIAYLKYF